MFLQSLTRRAGTLLAAAVLATTALTPAVDAAPRPTHAAVYWECNRLGTYQDRVGAILPGAEGGVLLPDAIPARPSDRAEMLAAAEDFAAISAELAAIAPGDVPRAATEYHGAVIGMTDVASTVLDALGTNDLASVYFLAPTMKTAVADLDAASQLGAERCGTAWTDRFGPAPTATPEGKTERE